MYNDDWMDPEPEEEVEPTICKKVKWWYNDLPLRAFCWGSPDDEHKEVSRVAPTQRTRPRP